jgi:hypothetical protein
MRSGHGLGRVAAVLLLGITPVVLYLALFRLGIDETRLAWDFHHELYPQAELMLDGADPYPRPGFDPAEGNNFVWPPFAAFLVAPLTPLPVAAADVVMALAGLACFALALSIVGVRDWRVYGVVALWPPVYLEIGLSHLTPVVAVLLALAWQLRERRLGPGVAAGLAIGLKLFVWPLALWLVALERRAAAVLAGAVAAISLALVLPFSSLGNYAHAVRDVAETFDQDAYTVYGLLAQLGAGDLAARLVTYACVGALLLGVWRYRSFTLAVAAALAASPIVWLDYFALAAVPLAIVRPRLSPVWCLPLLTVGLEGGGLAIGDAPGTLRALAVFTVVLGVAARAERAVATGTERDAGAREPVSLPQTRSTAGRT